MNGAIPTFWFPPDLALSVETATVQSGGLTESRAKLNSGLMEELCREMRARKRALTALGVERIIDVLHRASLAWIKVNSPEVAKTIGLISRRTGMSRPMVEQAIKHEMESSLAPDLVSAIRNEIGNPHYLDGFTYNPLLGGETCAVGPDLVGGIVSANLPGLPHLTVMRSLIVKAPCIVKTSISEPFFLPAYARTVWEIDPVVGRALAVVNFSRDEQEVGDAFLRGVDFLIAYGGLDAMARLKEQMPGNLPALLHGHKLGFGLIAGEALPKAEASRLARRIAYDVILFDQEACLAPHVVFVEGDMQDTCRLAARVAEEMRELSRDYPPGEKPLSMKLAIRQTLDSLSMSGDGARESRVFSAGDANRGLVVVQRAEEFLPSPLGRFVRLVPVETLEEALPLVRPLGHLLQNASVEANPGKRRALARVLADIGVSRICPPGNMGTPTMMWHHDGHPCIAAMLRFSDYEVRGRMAPPFIEQLDERLHLRDRLLALSTSVPDEWLERAGKFVERTRRLTRTLLRKQG